eukprot:1545461-Pleurochrysis_carterae.AAC.1
MARHRDLVDFDDGLLASVPRVTTRHTYRPPDRWKGSVSRLPCGVGGDKRAFISAKRHSVAEDSQSAYMERRESLKLGTHRTFLSVMATGSSESSKAV